jgi:two-component system, OmpR family, sensor histidine kinase PhoQ
MQSLSRRLLVSVAVPLVLFFGIAMFMLDRSFHQLLDRTVSELLDSQMIKLIAVAEPQPAGGYAVAAGDLDPQLAKRGSGVYAQIRSQRHTWRSPSAAGLAVDFGPLLNEGKRDLAYRPFGKEHIATESRGISFEDDPNQTRSLTFTVAVSLSQYDEQLWRFRGEMFGWLTGLMLLLLVALGVLLRWALAPARRLEREINEVEEGRLETLGVGYPRELRGVATHLNALLVGERKRVARYRDTLGNLAHSLKTPLAVMRAALSPEPSSSREVLCGEIDRMTGIIEHQLKRAAASGGALLGQAPVDVVQVVAELRTTLLRVYGRKDLAIEVAVDPGSQFVGDRGDLTELVGNLMDNACKWCRSRVRVTVCIDPAAGPRERLRLVVEDDGPGISQENRARVLERGVRTDESVPGHGIGLAMVHDTIDLYGGSLQLDTSLALGGARVSLRMPGR